MLALLEKIEPFGYNYYDNENVPNEPKGNFSKKKKVSSTCHFSILYKTSFFILNI